MEILVVDLIKDKFNDGHLMHMRELLKKLDKSHAEDDDNISYLTFDKEFHMYMCKMSGNENLYNMLDGLMEKLFRGNIITLKQGFDRRELLNSHHRKMYDCLEKRDFAHLKLALNEHVGSEWISKLEENWEFDR